MLDPFGSLASAVGSISCTTTSWRWTERGDEDDNGALDELIGIREELCRGDLHALAVAGGAPAVTAPQRALAAFLRLPAG